MAPRPRSPIPSPSPEGTEPGPGLMADQARLLTAALLEASRSPCDCGPCQTLRKMADLVLDQVKAGATT